MLELLWRVGWQSEYPEQVCDEDRRPNWSGFMQHVVRTDGEYPSSADVLFLPIIDLNPSDRHCVYSTLCLAFQIHVSHLMHPFGSKQLKY